MLGVYYQSNVISWENCIYTLKTMLIIVNVGGIVNTQLQVTPDRKKPLHFVYNHLLYCFSEDRTPYMQAIVLPLVRVNSEH